MAVSSRASVLIIDSDPTVRNSLTRLLRRAGYDVSTATKAGGGLKRLRSQEDFDCVITELMLPDMPGRDLIKAISEENLLPLSQVILLTVIHNVDNATAYLQYGCAAYIGKPYENTQVLHQIARVCGEPEDEQSFDAFM